MIAKGAITKRANEEQLSAQTIERDYVLAQLCADIGAQCEDRLVFKGGTLLRLCHFDPYRYSADLDFSAVDGLSGVDAIAIVAAATERCRERLEFSTLEILARDGTTAWLAYVGPLGSRPRNLKLDTSDSELVENHARIALQSRWPDLPDDAAIEGYALVEVAAEKLRCIVERLQCRDLYDLLRLLEGGHVDPLEAWELYLRKARNDVARGRQSPRPREFAAAFARRLSVYGTRWNGELDDYLGSDVPAFGDVERRIRRLLTRVLDAAQRLNR